MDKSHDCEQDLALVREVLADREDAIERFVQRMRCVPRILAAQNARMGRPLDEHDLADLTQDTLVVIWRKLDQYAGHAPIEGWVYRLCCLELMNGIRRKRRQPRLASDLSSGVTPERTSEAPRGPWEYEDVHSGIDWLGGHEAEVIRLKHFEDLTFEEIGRRLAVSPNTVKTRYYRGLIKLQEFLRSSKRRERRERSPQR